MRGPEGSGPGRRGQGVGDVVPRQAGEGDRDLARGGDRVPRVLCPRVRTVGLAEDAVPDEVGATALLEVASDGRRGKALEGEQGDAGP